MKLALFCILCLVSLSYQQYFFPGAQQQRSYFQNDPRLAFFYYPLNARTIADFSECNGLDGPSSSFSSGTISPTFENDESDLIEDAHARTPFRGSNYYEKPKSRFFFRGQLLSRLFFNSGSTTTVTAAVLGSTTTVTATVLSSTTTVTSTALATSVSTVVVASVRSCIGSAQFRTIAAVPAANGQAAVAATTLTASCIRKRRGIAMDEIVALEAIEPSQVKPLEATAAAAFPSFRRNSRSVLVDEPEIISSKELPEENKKTIANNRQKRQVFITTTTSTITSYSLSTTTVTQRLTPGGADGALTCVPAGYTVC